MAPAGRVAKLVVSQGRLLVYSQTSSVVLGYPTLDLHFHVRYAYPYCKSVSGLSRSIRVSSLSQSTVCLAESHKKKGKIDSNWTDPHQWAAFGQIGTITRLSGSDPPSPRVELRVRLHVKGSRSQGGARDFQHRVYAC